MTKTFAASVKPVHSVLLASDVGQGNGLSKLNKQIKDLLEAAGYEVHPNNGNGAAFGLTNLEQKIVKAADAFVFPPIPAQFRELQSRERKAFFREMFKAASLFVGAQTADPSMRLSEYDSESPLKPVVLVNQDGCWNGFWELVKRLNRLGTIRQDPRSVFSLVDGTRAMIDVLKKAHEQQAAHASGVHPTGAGIDHKEDISLGRDPGEVRKPDFNVCVFCSAAESAIEKHQDLGRIAHDIGTALATEGWGVISGLGKTGMMGQVVKGAWEVIQQTGKGWIAGSNIPRIVKFEGLPEGYDKIWVEDDIYRRMEVMIRNSQAFVIMPGGMGTVQELMALLLLKYAQDKTQPYLMHKKPIIVVNHVLESDGHKGEKFWDPLLRMAQQYGFYDPHDPGISDLIVVDTVEQAKEALQQYAPKRPRHAGRGDQRPGIILT